MTQQSLFWVSTPQIQKHLQWYMHSHVHCSIIHSGQDMETTKVSFGRWLDEEDMVPTYYGILLIHVDLESIMLREISQTEKAKNHMIALICGI